MSAAFRAKLKAEKEAAAAAEAAKASTVTVAPSWNRGRNAAESLDSYESTINRSGRDSSLQYNDPGSFEWGPYLLKKMLLGLNIFFLVMGVIVMALGGAASNANFTSIAGKDWTVAIACIGMLIFIMALLGAVAAYTGNRYLLMAYAVFLGALFISVFIIGIYIAAKSNGQTADLVRSGWNYSSNGARISLESYYQCCGLNSNADSPGYPCPVPANTTWPPCMPLFVSSFQQNFQAIGAMGIVIGAILAFCLLLTGVWLKLIHDKLPKPMTGHVRV